MEPNKIQRAGPSSSRIYKNIILKSREEILQGLEQISESEIHDEDEVLALQQDQNSNIERRVETGSDYDRASSPDIIPGTDDEGEGQELFHNNNDDNSNMEHNTDDQQVELINNNNSNDDEDWTIHSPQDFYISSDRDSDISIISNNEQDSSPPKSKKKKKHHRGRQEDDIWEQFNKVYDQNDKAKILHALCKKCKTKVSPRAPRLRQHKDKCKKMVVNNTTVGINNKEPNEFVPGSALNAVTVSNSLPSSSLSTSSKISNTKKKQQDIRKHIDIIKPKEREELDKKVGRVIFGANLPFRFVENKEFIDYTKTLKPAYQLPKRRMIGGSILDNVYIDIMKIVAQELKGKNVIIMQDGWSTKQNAPVVSHCLSTGEKTYFFDSIATEANKKDSDYCYSLLEDAMTKVHKVFQCKIIGFITDNCNAMKSLRKDTAEKNPELFTYGCNTHMLNNLGVGLSPGSLLDDVTNVNTFFRNHHYESSRLLQLQGTRPVLPCVTRWTSQCESIKSYLKNQTKFLEISRDPKSILKPLPSKPQSNKNIPESSLPKKKTPAEKAAEILSIINNSSVYDEATKLLEVLQPIAIALDKLQADNATVADAVQEWIKIEAMSALQHNRIFQKFQKDWRDLYMYPMNLAAHLLHPNYRGKGLSSSDKNRAHEFLSNKHPMLSVAAANLSIMNNDYFPSHSLKPEFINNLSSPNWWKFIATTETFSKSVTDFAADLMILPASTSGIERCFSTMSDILTKKRNRLGIQKASKLCIIYRTLSSHNTYLSSDDEDDYQ